MPRPCTVFVGMRFGALVVIERSAPGPRGQSRFICRCDCGNLATCRADNLLSGFHTSCGCKRGCAGKHYHGRVGQVTRTYRTWKSMHWRCNTPQPYHGALGVAVCARWSGERGFENFLADMGERPAGKTLDRFPDPSGNYEPENCRWATPSEQARNHRKRSA